MASGKWYYSKEKLDNSPSRKDGIDAVRELKHRQDAASLIHYMGERLNITNAVISSAIVYMHRFYVYHSFARFHRYTVSAAAIFLAAKSENMPKRLECVIRSLHACVFKNNGDDVDVASIAYQKETENLLFIEDILIQTLGFDLGIEHPHAYVLTFCQNIKASKFFSMICYFLATETLEMTTMCLRYSPKVIACFCMYFASKLSNWEISSISQERNWFYSDNDPTITLELLEELAQKFQITFDNSNSRWKTKIMSCVQGQMSPDANDQSSTSECHVSVSRTESLKPNDQSVLSMNSAAASPTFGAVRPFTNNLPTELTVQSSVISNKSDNLYQRPSIVVKIPREKIEESLDKISKGKILPLKIKLPKPQTDDQCSASVLPSAKRIKRF